jgi:hypothetical protein
MKCTEAYLDELLNRETIELKAIDRNQLAILGFEPKTVSDGENEVTDLMIRCPCDEGYRWQFYAAVAETGEGAGVLYGFREGMMTAPGFEYREYNDLRRMSKFNCGQEVDEWMVGLLRALIEQDAIEPEEAVE